jgi:flavin-dependent dehydrogenase
MNHREFDTIVIGAGPAGCTASTLLADKGRRVVMLEKETFPRYHIGESLMPFCWHTLEKLGVLDQMKERDFVQKLSVQFVTPDGKGSKPFFFFQHRDHPSSYTWQVERAEFDQMLFDNAKARGVDARDGVKVIRMIEDESGRVCGVVARLADGSETAFRASVTVDCTGRDAFIAARKGWRKRDPMLNKVAIWTYYKGAKRDEGLSAGSTTVAYLPEKGWFWYIPLRNDLVSVGIVAEASYLFRDTRDPAAIFAREIGNNAWIEDHLSTGEQTGEYWVTGEYSYRAEHCAGDGYLLAGDAFSFLDPVFSSGVFLALKSGEMAAMAIDEALTRGDTSAAAFDSYGVDLCSHLETMRKIVYAFYHQDFSFGEVIRRQPSIAGRLTDCLIGDMSQDFSGLFKAIAEVAELPDPLDYGHTGAKPFVPVG